MSNSVVVFRKFKSIRVLFLLIFSLSIGFVFAFELPAVKSEVTHRHSEQGEFYKVKGYKPVPIYGAEKRNKSNLTAEQQSLFFNSFIKKQAELHTVSGTYFTTKNNLKTVLMLNNKGNAPLYATPTVYSLAGTSLQLEPLEVGAASYKEFDLKELLADAGAEFREGSLAVTYQGAEMQLGVQLKLVDANRSLIWAEQFFVPAMKHTSSELEGVWWFPKNNAETKFVISNTSNETVTAEITVDGVSPKQKSPAVINLNPHETRVLDIIKDLVGKNNGILHTTGGVSIKHNGKAGAILAKMMIADSDRGFSSTMTLIDPQMNKSKRLHGAGLRLGKFGGEELNQVLVVRNTGDKPTKVSGKIIYTKEADETDEVISIEIPSRNIAPNSTKAINLKQIIKSANIPADVEIAGIEMEYDTKAGSVLMNLINTSDSGTHVFETPMLDPKTLPSSAGGYPWKVDGDFRTIIYIKNETDEARDFTISLHHTGGIYTLGLRKIKPHETKAIDFKKLRDEHTPDINNEIIPLNIESGQIGWSSKGIEANKTLTGYSEQVSEIEGIASTYNCANCCPNSNRSSRLNPDTATGFVGSTTQFTLLATDENCYGQPQGEYPVNSSQVTWGSSEPSVATCNNNGLATGTGVGQTGITGFHQVEYWTHSGGICYPNYFQALANAFCQILQSPTVTSLKATIPATKNPTTPQIPAPDSYSTSNVSTAFATESTTDLMVVFQSSTEIITVKAEGINPSNSASQLKWKIDRETTGGTPSLTSTNGSQTTFKPTVSGNFRLICYFDMNNNGSYDNGEELRVLLFAVISVTINQNDCTIDSPLINFQYGEPPENSTEFGVFSGIPMAINCQFLIEGGGTDKKIGVNKVSFGNLGNLTLNNAKVNYMTQGTATENPGGSLPMFDGSTNQPTGGNSVFRSTNSTSVSNGGKTINVSSLDAPNFGNYLKIHPNTNNTWNSTEGGYNFKEYIVGYSTTFLRSYVVIAKADWTIRFVGTRNSNGTWTDGSSSVTLQGVNQNSANMTQTVTNGSPKTGNSENIQVFGPSFALSHTEVYTP